MNARLAGPLVLAATLVLAGCAAPAAEPEPRAAAPSPVAQPTPDAPAILETIAIGGSSAAMDGFRLAAERFMALAPAVKVNTVAGLGSSGSIKAVAAGGLDISVASRVLKPAEAELGLAQSPYYDEAIVLFVHPSAGVTAVSAEQLAGMYRGEIHNWNEVGGSDLPVRLVTRERDDSETERVIERYPILDSEWAPSVTLVDTDDLKLQYLAANPGAVGFANARQVGLMQTPLRAVDFEDLVLTRDSMADGAYPLLVHFHIVYQPGIDGAARDMRDYLLGDEWQALLDQALLNVV